jgi:2-polyprenyl-3-methyl-5-hydroxy-6-metoxy-1,4-benzoquinol methylase
MTRAEIIQFVNCLYRNEKNLGGLMQRLRPYIAPFHRLLPLTPKGSRVLDVGCGSGLWPGLLVAAGQAEFCYGFDSSRKAIALAQRMRNDMPKEQGNKLFFEYRSVTDGLPKEQFDVVTMIDVMHHIPRKHQDQALLDIWACVKNDGLFVYKDMASKPRYCGIMNRLHDLVVAREWIRYYPIDNVKKILSENGGHQEKKAQIFSQHESCRMFFWYQHEWVVFRKAATVNDV